MTNNAPKTVYISSIGGEDMPTFRVPLKPVEFLLGIVSGILLSGVSMLLLGIVRKSLLIESPSLLTVLILGSLGIAAAPMIWLTTWYRPSNLATRLETVAPELEEGTTVDN